MTGDGGCKQRTQKNNRRFFPTHTHTRKHTHIPKGNKQSKANQCAKMLGKRRGEEACVGYVGGCVGLAEYIGGGGGAYMVCA